MKHYDIYRVCPCGHVIGTAWAVNPMDPCPECHNWHSSQTCEVLYWQPDWHWYNPWTWGAGHYESSAMGVNRVDDNA